MTDKRDEKFEGTKKLFPCPFCGNEPEIQDHFDNTFSIKCVMNCSVQPQTKRFSTKKLARQRWNLRVPVVTPPVKSVSVMRSIEREI